MSKNTAAKRRINPRTGGSFVRQSTGNLKQVAGTKTPAPAEAPTAETTEQAEVPPAPPETSNPPAKGGSEPKDSGK